MVRIVVGPAAFKRRRGTGSRSLALADRGPSGPLTVTPLPVCWIKARVSATDYLWSSNPGAAQADAVTRVLTSA
jgi:hypothetical protein